LRLNINLQTRILLPYVANSGEQVKMTKDKLRSVLPRFLDIMLSMREPSSFCAPASSEDAGELFFPPSLSSGISLA
jgi:hypothetical protein